MGEALVEDLKAEKITPAKAEEYVEAVGQTISPEAKVVLTKDIRKHWTLSDSANADQAG
jgi:predicted Ser/Thr protein kinase